MRRNGEGPPRGSWLLGGPSRGGGSAGIRTAEQNQVAGGYRFQPARRLQRAHLQVLSAVKHADVVVVLEGHPRKNKEKADLGASSTITQHDIIDGSYLHVILEESHDYSHSQGA